VFGENLNPCASVENTTMIGIRVVVALDPGRGNRLTLKSKALYASMNNAIYIRMKLPLSFKGFKLEMMAVDFKFCG
jgi:hypothetical protein